MLDKKAGETLLQFGQQISRRVQSNRGFELQGLSPRRKPAIEVENAHIVQEKPALIGKLPVKLGFPITGKRLGAVQLGNYTQPSIYEPRQQHDLEHVARLKLPVAGLLDTIAKDEKSGNAMQVQPPMENQLNNLETLSD